VAELLTDLETLVSHSHPEGGWGYEPGQAARLEPTCLALLALWPEREHFQAAVNEGLAAIERSALGDGAYHFPGDREEAMWPTALVLFLHAVTGHSLKDLELTTSRLLSWQGRNADNQLTNEVHDIDLKLVGWPWAVSNFSWVEPTAWACLALRQAGHGDHPRVVEGLRLLLDRTFDEGGINYGNRTVLGRRLEPIPGPTALTLLALQAHDHHPRIASTVRYLLQQAMVSEDLEHLCWARLALDCHCDQPDVADSLPTIDNRIVAARAARDESTWLRPAVVREALTALALAAAQRNPFRLHKGTGKDHGCKLQPERPATIRFTRRRRPWGQRVAAAFRGLAVEAAGRLRQAPTQSAVHVAKAADYGCDLAGILQRQYEAFRGRVPLAGRRVVIKPNLVEYHRDKVINTHPHVVAAVIELCLREGAAEVCVAEGPGHWRNVEYLVVASGLGDVLRHYQTPFKDLNHDEPVKTLNLGRLTRLEHLYLARTIASADVLISLPKLKTHHWAGATLSLKNLFGTLPGVCYGWPKNELHWRGIANSIIDIALTRAPDLEIVDGIVGMEGDGPLKGEARPLGALIMGCDPVAVDATCCRLMQLDPEKIEYLMLGYEKRLGLVRATEIQQIGERIETLAQPFETVSHFEPLRLACSA
jgi:uncharacterized protein (DUF362 family)